MTCAWCNQPIIACPRAGTVHSRALGCRGYVHDGSSWHICDPSTGSLHVALPALAAAP